MEESNVTVVNCVFINCVADPLPECTCCEYVRPQWFTGKHVPGCELEEEEE